MSCLAPSAVSVATLALAMVATVAQCRRRSAPLLVTSSRRVVEACPKECNLENLRKALGTKMAFRVITINTLVRGLAKTQTMEGRERRASVIKESQALSLPQKINI